MASDQLRIYLFEEPHFEWAGETRPFSAPPKTLPLLAYLLLHRSAPLAREKLASVFWPDADQVSAFANLRRHLHYLARALPNAPAAPWLAISQKTVAWNPESPYWLDVETFETESRDRDLRARAVRLYSGDLYERCSEEWIEFHRERLRTLQLSNLSQLTSEARSRASYVEALQYAQLMLAVDRWREDALRTTMEIRILLHDRAGALGEYERFAQRLDEDLQTVPLAETTALYERIRQSTALSPGPQATKEGTRTLVGRRNESATLRDEWQRAARGEGRAVFIGGEAGIGKSTLLQTLRDGLTQTGALDLEGSVAEHESLPYSALINIARTAVENVTPQKLSTREREALGILLPELHPAITVAAAPSQDERLRLFEALADLLERLSRKAPLLIAIEDLHLAGSATMDALSYMIPRLIAARVLFVGTYREFEVGRGHPLRMLRRHLAQTRRFTNLALSSLSREDVETLACAHAGRRLSAEILRRIYERSAGNPLFVVEIVRELAQTDFERVPASIAEIVRRRLQRLDETACSVLKTAAVAGGSWQFELLAQVTGMGEGELILALAKLLEAHFVRQGAAVNEFEFVHELDSTGNLRRHRRRCDAHDARPGGVCDARTVCPALCRGGRKCRAPLRNRTDGW